MHAKHERVDSWNYFKGMAFLTPVYLSFCNQIRRSIYRSRACFDALMFTIYTSQSNQAIGRWGSTPEPCI